MSLKAIVEAASSSSCADKDKVNLIGVVVEYGLPKTTKGTDCFCLVRIVDDSLPTGIGIHFFAEDMDHLPLVDTVGDILLISRVLIHRSATEVYASFHKKISTFALLQGRASSFNSFQPYQSSPTYKLKLQHKKKILQLWQWSLTENIGGFHPIWYMRDVHYDVHYNVLCKILHVAQVNENECMLYIWDGTDAPPASLNTKLEDEMENPLPLALERSPLSRDILCTFPTIGTVLRVTVNQSREKLGIRFLKANKWVKIINLRCEKHASLLRGVLEPYSKICYLRNDDDVVIRHQRSFTNLAKVKYGRMPFTAFSSLSCITETDHPKVGVLTLMDVLTYTEVTYKYKCVVRIVAIYPWRAEDFRSPNGIYRVRVTLEDPTARIHAYIYKEDGAKFFENCHSVDELTEMRDALLGVAGASTEENATRNPPWIECCLKSYYVKEDDKWGSRNYRICDTTCVADHGLFDGSIGF